MDSHVLIDFSSWELLAMEMVERESDLLRLHDHLRQVAAGQGRVVFLAGEAGVGKTALADEFCRRIPVLADVLGVSCDALSTPGPLGPVRDIGPALGIRPDDYPVDREGRDRLFHAVLNAFAARDRPTVVVPEDAHWADGASLEMLCFLARRIEEQSLFILVTFRDDETSPDHPLRLLLGDLATVHRLRLPPLSEAAVRHVAQGSERDAAALHRLTGGNPLYLTEALATVGTGVPPSVGTPCSPARHGSRPRREQFSTSRR